MNTTLENNIQRIFTTATTVVNKAIKELLVRKVSLARMNVPVGKKFVFNKGKYYANKDKYGYNFYPKFELTGTDVVAVIDNIYQCIQDVVLDNALRSAKEILYLKEYYKNLGYDYYCIPQEKGFKHKCFKSQLYKEYFKEDFDETILPYWESVENILFSQTEVIAQPTYATTIKELRDKGITLPEIEIVNKIKELVAEEVPENYWVSILSK